MTDPRSPEADGRDAAAPDADLPHDDTPIPHVSGGSRPAAAPPVQTTGPAVPRSGIGRSFVRLYGSLHALAERGWASTAVGTWSFLQGAAIPGPVDALLVPLGLADPPKAYRFAWAAVLGAVLGTLVAYAAGMFAYDSVGVWVLNLVGVEGPGLDVWRGRFQRQGWWVVFLTTVTPLSGKLVSVAAGAFGMPLWKFVGAMFVGRTLRSLAVAFVVRRFGAGLAGWAERRYGVTLDELARGERRSRGHTTGAGSA